MELTLAILLCIIFAAFVSGTNKKRNAAETPKAIVNITEYPYKKTYLLTKTEYAFYKILKTKCDEKNLLICPKVRLEDFIQVTAQKDKLKYRGYIKSRHVDFLICDSRLNIIAAVELDDSSHNSEKAVKTDNFKNRLFSVIGIPLHRVVVGGGAYENVIDNMLESLTGNY